MGGRGGEGANKSVNHRASPSGPSAVNPRPLLMPQARHAFVPASEATSIEADRCGVGGKTEGRGGSGSNNCRIGGTESAPPPSHPPITSP